MKKSTLLTLGLSLFIINQSLGQIITTIAGTGARAYSGDGGTATAAALNIPRCAVAHNGNVYITDLDNHAIRKIDATGIITTIAGNGTSGFSGDGGPATAAQLWVPNCIAFDNAGNLYFTDRGNNRVRKIDVAGIITTVAGNGSATDAGDGGPATAGSIYSPTGIAIDNAGNIFVASWMNHKVRKISTAGIITTYAGTGVEGGAGDGGPAIAAQLNDPDGLAVDKAGNLYIGDSYNYKVRKVNTAGIISTVAGNGALGFSGDGGPATAASFGPVAGIAVDTLSRLYIADMYRNRIRMVDETGYVTTIAGDGAFAYGGDGGPATAASLFEPTGVSVDPTGNVYVADFLNSRVRTFKLPLLPGEGHINGFKNAALVKQLMNVWPQPCNGNFSLNIATQTKADALITICGIDGGQVKSLTAPTNENISINAELSPGVYVVTAHIGSGQSAATVVVK